jgi:hypothetical protein
MLKHERLHILNLTPLLLTSFSISTLCFASESIQAKPNSRTESINMQGYRSPPERLEYIMRNDPLSLKDLFGYRREDILPNEEINKPGEYHNDEIGYRSFRIV